MAALQARAVEAVLGQGPTLRNPLCKLPPEVVGAWAAILIVLARRCARDAAPRLAEVPRTGEAAVVSATVALGGELFGLRVGVPLEAIPAVERFDRAALAGLGSTPLTVPLVGACGLVTREELEAMVPGAAWFPGDAWFIQREQGSWSGIGWLVSGGSERGAQVELRYDGASLALVLRCCSGSLSWEPPMTSSSPDPKASENDLADTLAEIPVVVRVEVASVTLEAQQWARLGPGDVVATGVRLGEPVVLRAGGHVFARGELCILEGELAVKILQRC
ncbi:MAG: FliM/FliN family flagellar motor switch protein [Myxococcales bacterium]|nr:FliM/FliN family flagellar motor switch protein [Myxococcales bacterium]